MTDPRPVCGGARIADHDNAGCGTPLVYAYTAHGLEHWNCPRCGNAHWWPVEAKTDQNLIQKEGGA